MLKVRCESNYIKHTKLLPKILRTKCQLHLRLNTNLQAKQLTQSYLTPYHKNVTVLKPIYDHNKSPTRPNYVPLET